MIYHIVKEKDYLTRNDGNKFLPLNYHEIGFIHCALETSVLPVANDYYIDSEEKLLLLRIEPSKLSSQTKFEPASPEKGFRTSHITSSPVFPHVYGPINNSAVDGIGELLRENNGYIWPKVFISLGEYMSANNNVPAISREL